MKIPTHILSPLTDEQKKKAEAARSPEELLALAKEAGYELTSEQLESISGGEWCAEDCCVLCENHQGCPYVCVPYGTCPHVCVYR